MEREIKFRGKCYGVWRYGSYVHFSKKPIHNVCDNSRKDFIVANENDGEHYYPITELSSIGEYTGLKDKNGREIYEGDIIEYYETYNYCINPDCEPCIQGYGLRLCKKTVEVQFVDGVFGVEKSEYSLIPLIYCGIREEYISDIKEYAENSAYFDANGYNVDGSIVGIEVIGNIHDNPELIK